MTTKEQVSFTECCPDCGAEYNTKEFAKEWCFNCNNELV